MAPADMRAVLADVAGLGPFFVVGTDPAEVVDPTWRPVRELYADPAAAADRIAQVGRALGSDERVAASIAFQGLAAMLVSAPYAAVVLHGVLPGLTASALQWRPSAGGPWRFWCADPQPVPGPDPAAALAELLVDEHLAPLAAAVRKQVSIAERLLWGSAASAVASAKRLVAMARPAAARRATEVAERVLATGPFAGTGELLPARPPDHDWTFRRRSCCLYYRAPGGGLCEDCVLHAGRGGRQ